MVRGTCHPKFEGVRRELERNFLERAEVGASVCVIVGGETVVDLWGGITQNETGAPWQENTLCHVWSCTKGATALCAHLLVARGLLDLEAPVVEYWPEFGQQGKATISVAMLLNHQAGLPAIRRRLPARALHDWEFMVTALAAEAPFWEPGTRHGYSSLTFGFLIGELVRRVAGRSLGRFFSDEVATPLKLDFWIGLPEEEEARVARSIAPEPPDPKEPVRPFFARAQSDPTSVPALVFFNNGGYLEPLEADSRAAHAAEIGASGGITNARGLARMYAALAAGRRGTELMNPDMVMRMARVASATGQDAVLGIPTRFSLGFMKSMDNRRRPAGQTDSVILSEEAFGHSGFGGSIGFADPRASMSFGYVMNKMAPGICLDARGQALIDATYEALGYTSNASGSWGVVHV